MNTISLQFTCLITILMIGLFNWMYGMRIEKVRHQLGIELPGVSIALLKIGTLFVVFSACVIVCFIAFTAFTN